MEVFFSSFDFLCLNLKWKFNLFHSLNLKPEYYWLYFANFQFKFVVRLASPFGHFQLWDGKKKSHSLERNKKEKKKCLKKIIV